MHISTYETLPRFCRFFPWLVLTHCFMLLSHLGLTNIIHYSLANGISQLQPGENIALLEYKPKPENVITPVVIAVHWLPVHARLQHSTLNVIYYTDLHHPSYHHSMLAAL